MIYNLGCIFMVMEEGGQKNLSSEQLWTFLTVTRHVRVRHYMTF